eukprot:6211331-Pleurochrysis_carterae.AAC.1
MQARTAVLQVAVALSTFPFIDRQIQAPDEKTCKGGLKRKRLLAESSPIKGCMPEREVDQTERIKATTKCTTS